MCASHESLFQLMNHKLLHVVDWFRVNKLSLNLNKSNYILFCSHRKSNPDIKLTISMENFNIPQITTTKFLGVHVDQFLTWNVYIESISKTYILTHIAFLLPSRIRLIGLCYSIFHPYLSYCNIVWASNYSSRLTRLTLLQNRAAKIIMGLSRLSPSHLLLSKLRILAIDQIRVMQTSELMFKHMHLLHHAFADLFTLTSELVPCSFRSSLNYRGIITRTNTRMFLIKSAAGPRTWNNLHLFIRNSVCFTLFKT
jgi:hypothetical protein